VFGEGTVPPPLPRRVPQVPPPPFGVAVSPGGESLFQPPTRKARLREPDPPPGESADFPRRPAAGGLIAGWNRPEPEEDPPGAGEAFAAPGEPAPPPLAPSPPASPESASRRATELWDRRPSPGAPETPDRPRRIPDAWAQPPDPTTRARPDDQPTRMPPAPPPAPRGNPLAEAGASGPARVDPWDRPAVPARPDDWDRVTGTASPGGEGRPPAGGWTTVLPPAGGTPAPQDRTEDRTAGVDEATTFLSQWGPPPLRPTEGAPGRSGPGAPSGAGAGWSADNPVERPRPDPGWSGPGAAPLPPVADAPPPSASSSPPDAPRIERAPTVPAAERWIADRLAADRAAADRAADRAEPGASDDRFPGSRPAGRAPAANPGRAADRAEPDASDDRLAGPRPAGRPRAANPGRAAGQQPVEEGFAYWVTDRSGGAADGAPPADAGAGQRPAELTGPLGVGAWSRESTAARGRPRGRQRPEQPDPIDRRPDDRTPSGGGGGEPLHRGGGGEPARGRRTLGDRIRTFLRGIGQTFITLGLVFLLLAAYEVWFTDLLNHRTQKRLTTALQDQWEQGGDDPTVAVPGQPGQKVREIPLGDAFALIYIPDFGTDYVFSVVQGTGMDQLNEGPGHYVDSPLPGAVGNVAIAGHRVGKGSPFLNLDKLGAGSAIVLRTKSYWYTYRVVGDGNGDADRVSALGFPGREIVDPSDVGVIAPVPDKPGAKPTRRLLTLTTCHPKFTARQRMVIHAQLEGAPFPVGKGTPPSMTGA
jgi:sortase A